MKLRADRAQLAEALAWVARVVPTRADTAELAGVQLHLADQELTAQAFNFETSHTARLEVDSSGEPGQALVSARFLAFIVGALKGSEVELELDGRALRIAAGRSTYRTPVLAPPERWPSLPRFPLHIGQVEADSFTHAIALAASATEENTSHQRLRGIRLEADDQELIAVGASHAALTMATTPWDGHRFTATTPGRALRSALAGMSGELHIGHDDGLLGIGDDQRQVTLRCFDSDHFMAWRRVLPDPTNPAPIQVVLDPAELADAARRAARVLPEDKPLLLEVGEDHLELTGAGPETGAGTEHVEAETTGTVRLGINPHLLAGQLDVLGPDPVELHITKPLAAIVLNPQERPEATALVQPMRLPQESR